MSIALSSIKLEPFHTTHPHYLLQVNSFAKCVQTLYCDFIQPGHDMAKRWPPISRKRTLTTTTVLVGWSWLLVGLFFANEFTSAEMVKVLMRWVVSLSTHFGLGGVWSLVDRVQGVAERWIVGTKKESGDGRSRRHQFTLLISYFVVHTQD